MSDLPVGECDEWTGYKNDKGYGKLTIDYRQVYAHRLVVMQEFGHLTPDQVVMHLCDNPGCVNLAHLRVGTQQDNLQDAAAKKRWPKQNNCKRGHALTPDNVYVYPDGRRRRCRTCLKDRPWQLH